VLSGSARIMCAPGSCYEHPGDPDSGGASRGARGRRGDRLAVTVSETASVPVGRFDQGQWKKAQRHGRERGCRVNISAEQLAQMGIDPHGPEPEYRIWASTDRPRAVISLRVAP
jgi:hypothetical protein